MMRYGLKRFLDDSGDFVVCGEAGDATGALSEIERASPDLILLDISLRGRSGLDLLKDLRARFSDIPVLVHSMHDETVFAERVFRAGARGYLMKQEAGDHLATALRTVLRGEVYLSDKIKSGGATSGAARSIRANGKQTPIASLTHREFEVFRLIGRGFSGKEIAGQLHLSQKTIDAHREHMKAKLRVHSSTELNLLAVRWAACEQEP
jgi:DNA-binding NarL/FixJ family response regulator